MKMSLGEKAKLIITADYGEFWNLFLLTSHKNLTLCSVLVLWKDMFSRNTCIPVLFQSGYGSSGAGGVIPPNADLIFEVNSCLWKCHKIVMHMSILLRIHVADQWQSSTPPCQEIIFKLYFRPYCFNFLPFVVHCTMLVAVKLGPSKPHALSNSRFLRACMASWHSAVTSVFNGRWSFLTSSKYAQGARTNGFMCTPGVDSKHVCQ